MKQSTRSFWLSSTGLLLALPTLYFLFIAILKYELNVPGPFDSASPLLEKLGFKESLGWNINLLILFGPVFALLLALLQVVKINWQISKEDFRFHVTIYKRWFPLGVALLSAGLLAILFIYLAGENCNC
ncbi:MAG TPA: hypothetical protein VFX58_12100 [Chitinophagaceae bacterium]|nr:hypothetical protein [Chitinophagaceae bacterium]